MRTATTFLAALLVCVGSLSCALFQLFQPPREPGAVPGAVVFNEAAALYNDKKYAEAIPLFEKALKQSSGRSVSGEAGQVLSEAAKVNEKAARFLAESRYQLGRATDAPGEREKLWKKAEPTLKALFESTPEDKVDERKPLAARLLSIAELTKDAKGVAVYKAAGGGTGRAGAQPEAAPIPAAAPILDAASILAAAAGANNAAAVQLGAKDYAGAVTSLDSAVRDADRVLSMAAADGDARAQAQRIKDGASAALADALYAAGKTDPGKYWPRAEAFLKASFDGTPSGDKSARRGNLAKMLRDISDWRYGKDSAASASYRSAIKEIEGPTYADVFNDDARPLIDAGRYREAIPHLERAVRMESSFYNGRYWLGHCQYETGSSAAAKASLELYLRQAPNGENARTAKAILKEIDGSKGAPGAPVANAADVADVAAAAYETGLELNNAKKYAAAVPRLESAIRKADEAISAAAADGGTKARARKTKADAEYQLAESLYRVGLDDPGKRGAHWPRAEAILKAHFDRMPGGDKSNARKQLAIRLRDISDWRNDARAADRYRSAIAEIDGPQTATYWNQNVLPRFNEEKYEEAIPYIKKTIETDKGFHKAYYLLAYCQYETGEYAEARANAQEYLRREPGGQYAGDAKDLIGAVAELLGK